MDLAEPAHDRPDELAGALAVLVELHGQRECSAQVAGHEGIGEVVGAGCCVGGGQPLHVRGGHVRGRVHGEGDLLELPREALLAGADPGHELLRSLPVELQPELARVADAPLRQLPRPGGGVFADLAAGLFHCLCQLLLVLTASNEDEDGFGWELVQRLFERGELACLPGADVVHQQVAGGRLEAQHRERGGNLARVALAGVEQLEATRSALVLGPAAHTGAPSVDLGVVVSADEVGGVQGGHTASLRRRAGGPRPVPPPELSARSRSRCARLGR